MLLLGSHCFPAKQNSAPLVLSLPASLRTSSFLENLPPGSRLYARTLDKLTNDLSVLLLIEQLLANDNYNDKKSLHILANADLVLDTALSILHVLWHGRATVTM